METLAIAANAAEPLHSPLHRDALIQVNASAAKLHIRKTRPSGAIMPIGIRTQRRWIVAKVLVIAIGHLAPSLAA